MTQDKKFATSIVTTIDSSFISLLPWEPCRCSQIKDDIGADYSSSMSADSGVSSQMIHLFEGWCKAYRAA